MDVTLRRDGVTATVHAVGCMTTFEAEVEGRVVAPLYVAPWPEGEVEGMLGHLRGDFPCVPFGIAPDSMTDFPAAWRDVDPGVPGEAHGYSTGAQWEAVVVEDGAAEFEVRYPDDDAVASLRRRVECIDGGIEVTDTVVMRRPARLPLGLHPIFRLPERPGDGVLHLPDCEVLLTKPVPADVTSVLVPDAVVADPTQAPAVDGGTVDLTSLPLPMATEEVVLLGNVSRPWVAFDNLAEGYRLTMEWEPEALRHLQVWYSNRGRQFAPWNGRNLCLGVEPVTAPFDLGPDIAAAPNPVADRGLATAVELVPERPTQFRHRITVAPLAAAADGGRA